MKIFYLGISMIVLFASCSSDIKTKNEQKEEKTITFIADFKDPNTEVVIKKLIRNSVMEEEYLILQQNDTIILNSIGRSFYTAGVRSTVLDSLVIDMGDIINVSIENDSIQFRAFKSKLGDNLKWLRKYQYEVEDAYATLFEQITDKSANLEFLKKPFIVYNDYQISQSLYSHIYQIDRKAYGQNKSAIDNLLSKKYTQFTSQIVDSDLDQGSKQIMQHLLFNSTLDKFRRMGSTLQNWMYDNLNDEVRKDCSFQLDTKMSDFYFNFKTGKNHSAITFIDLQKTYHLLDQITCPEHQQEIKRVCLLKMFMNGNKINDTKKLLNQYNLEYKDSVFYTFIEERFPINDATLKNRGTNGSYVDIYDQDKTYDELISQQIGNVILIDFWASWCAPCRKSMPDVKKLEKKYEDQDFKVIYISIDKYPNQWKKASKDEDLWNNNNYWAYNFHDSEVYKNFSITHIPRYIIYGKDGRVAYQKAPKPNAAEDIIEQLLLE